MSDETLATARLWSGNARLVVGLPDTEAQFERSWDRRGFARQFRSPDEWRLGLREAAMSNLLVDAKDAWRVFDYFGRRRELDDLRRYGLQYWLGASRANLESALKAPALFTKIWTHTRPHEDDLEFEFSDGFLSSAELAKIVHAGHCKFIDLCACEAQQVVSNLKRRSPDRFFIASGRLLSGLGWGLQTTLFMHQVVTSGGTFPDLWKSTLSLLKRFSGDLGDTDDLNH